MTEKMGVQPERPEGEPVSSTFRVVILTTFEGGNVVKTIRGTRRDTYEGVLIPFETELDVHDSVALTFEFLAEMQHRGINAIGEADLLRNQLTIATKTN